ncbi:MAG: hypothetical protein HOD64_01535 [Candidatus Cloacimonetes bacterium]|jgi:uncharacterized membrane protein YheB (UPF0754 family)|nr:hypothetical protein [Candidatus Cloacimonadota bacterium]MBT4331933.1 hypothetical protein [Candidatus Cloacimonadota bacterium]MBT4575475.1 hypothetical protein [Candidatus Cloacimonadota bacterium]
MFIIKPLIFIIINMLVGFLYIFAIKFFLFIPSKEIKINNKRLPFTPAFVFRKKIWLFKKIRKLVNDYINDTKDDSDGSRITKWEYKIFHQTWDKITFMDKYKFIPKSVKNNVKYFISTIAFEVVKQFLRTFIPFLMEKYELNKYIELLDKKLNVDLIKEYFNKYIYKYVLIFVLAIHFLIGLGNMLIYLFVK